MAVATPHCPLTALPLVLLWGMGRDRTKRPAVLTRAVEVWKSILALKRKRTFHDNNVMSFSGDYESFLSETTSLSKSAATHTSMTGYTLKEDLARELNIRVGYSGYVNSKL